MMAEQTPDGPDLEAIIAAVAAEMEALRGDGATFTDPKTKLAENTYTVEELDAIPDPPWLIDEILPANGLGIIWGESGAYKTFVALDLACRIASGLHAWERRTSQASVLYVAGEGAHGIRKRIRAWRQAHPDADLSRLFVCTYPPPLVASDQIWAQGLADLAAEIMCEVTILDTVARSFGGGDENETKDMGLFVSACDRVARATGGAVIGVHHSGHDKSRMRGNSALYAACDFVLGVTRPADNWCQMSNAWAAKGKAKDAEEMSVPITFRLDKVGNSLVPVQADPADIPAGSDDVEPREPRSMGSDRLARISVVVEALRSKGGGIASQRGVGDAIAAVDGRKWHHEKVAKALNEAVQAGAVVVFEAGAQSLGYRLVEGWKQ